MCMCEYAGAEYGTLEVMHWQIPRRCVDLDTLCVGLGTWCVCECVLMLVKVGQVESTALV